MVLSTKLKRYFAASILVSAIGSGVLYAQDEKTAKAEKTPIADEFSLVMRSFMKRAQAGQNRTPPASSMNKLGTKVDGIQALLNQSESELTNVAKLESDSQIPKSETMQIQELENLKVKMEMDEERQLAELLITKAKIASIQKNIKSERRRLALKKAEKGVDAALKIVEGVKD